MNIRSIIHKIVFRWFYLGVSSGFLVTYDALVHASKCLVIRSAFRNACTVKCLFPCKFAPPVQPGLINFTGFNSFIHTATRFVNVIAVRKPATVCKC